jgi:hypothetical protein
VSTSLLDVLVGQRVRLMVARQESDPAKGEERSHREGEIVEVGKPRYREVEIVGQLLHLPDDLQGAKPSVFAQHSVYGTDGKRHTVWDDTVRRVEVLDPASEEVILFAKCTGESDRITGFGTPRHGSAQCCVHEVHVGRALGRESPTS